MSDVPELLDVAGGQRVAWIVVAAVALTGVFVLLGFPYDRVAERLVERIERDTGARIEIGPISPSWVRWAPGIAAENVRVVTSDGMTLDLDRVGVRPALSFSWLRGRPSLGIDLQSVKGNSGGELRLGALPAFDGTFERLDLEVLPQDRLGTGLRLSGTADADVDLVFGDDGADGTVEFDARDGMVAHPNLPLPVPYEKLAGTIELGGETTATIRELEIESAIATGQAQGTIGRGANFPSSPLDLEIGLTVSGPVRGSLNAQGVEVDNVGQVVIRVTGTVGRPLIN